MQNYDLQLEVNDIGPFLFTKLLTPTLVATAKSCRESSELPEGGVIIDNLSLPSTPSAKQAITCKEPNLLNDIGMMEL